MTDLDQKTLRIVTNHILNNIKPLAEKHSLPLETWPPNLLKRMCILQAKGKIDSRRVKRWIEERIGERELEKEIGMPKHIGEALNESEIDALER